MHAEKAVTNNRDFVNTEEKSIEMEKHDIWNILC